jgi:hypothetical protein
MKLHDSFLAIALLLACTINANAATSDNGAVGMRAPAYPLVTIDPYTSAWSFSDTLYCSSVKHWTGRDFPLLGVIKVDGKPYRFMGTEDNDITIAAPNADNANWEGRFVTQKPADGWEKPDFDDSSWQQSAGGFGTDEYSIAKTKWTTPDIWVRRIVNIDSDLAGKDIFLEFSHDDAAVIYINGVKAVDTGDNFGTHFYQRLSGEAAAALKPGKNVIAAYCHNNRYGGVIDFGLYTKDSETKYFTNTATQKSVTVLPTSTVYTFDCGPVQLGVKFTAPLLLDSLELISRPVNYITYDITATDNKAHQVQIYLEASPQWAMNTLGQSSVTETFTDDDLMMIKSGTKQQNILGTKGDDVRIDWGYFYLAADAQNALYGVGTANKLRSDFMSDNFIAADAKQDNSRAAIVRDLGNVDDATGYFLIGYDDIYSVQYFGDNLRPYWNRNGDQTITGQFHKAVADYDILIDACNKFDSKLIADAKKAGGDKYSALCALAYRQAIAAHKLLQAPNGDLLFLSKENFSNGSIGTVDVAYPASPLFTLYNPKLVEGMMNPIIYYAESGRWTKPFSAHDVGVYPIASGNRYDDPMPVEESGNMLIMAASVTKAEGNANYANKHWVTLTKWADYLLQNGLDPSNQLCTDDFAGHLAHNANLSIKAILGIASYGYMAGMLGKKDVADRYMQSAQQMAAQWVKMADDGDHYRLAFDKPGTWSQKYNLVWDKLMGWNIFPKSVSQKELNYYLTKLNKYGLPLDNRATYTKSDWIHWTATMASDKATFEKLVDPIYDFMGANVDRAPMTDWFYTDKPNTCAFRARSVVGGYFIKLLENRLK